MAGAQLPDYHLQVIQHSSLTNVTQIEQIMKDEKGFLWLLAPSGIQRFDGKHFVSFPFEDRCASIQEDEEGTIWVTARQTIYRYKNDHTGFEKLPEYTTSRNHYRKLLTGPGKRVYLLAANGIERWDKNRQKFEPFGIAPFKSSGSFPFLRSFDNWLFYKLNDTTLARYNLATATQQTIRVFDANYLLPINADSVWVKQGLGNTALVSFTAKTVTPVNAAQFNHTFTDNRFFVTGGFRGEAPGEFFVNFNSKGYYVYHTAQNRFTKAELFLNGRPLRGEMAINSFYQEENSTVWFAHEEGLMYFKPFVPGFGLLRSNSTGSPQEWSNNIRSFAEDAEGNIWFSTANGFCKWNKSNGKVSVWLPKYGADDYLNYPSIRSLGFSNNKLIVGQTEGGFWLFNPQTGTFERPPAENDGLHGSFNANMLRLRNGNFLIFSSTPWLLEKGTGKLRELQFTGSDTYLKAACEDDQGRIWMVGRGGIYVVDSLFRGLYAYKDLEAGKWYNGIVQVDKETFWAAAKNIYEIKLRADGSLSRQPIFPELQHPHFSHLFKDSLSRIWMSSEQGLHRYIPEKQVIEAFDQRDNVQYFNVTISNSFRASDGTVYLGSMNGINYFVPEQIPLQGEPLQVHLLNVTVNHDDSSYLLHHTLPALRHTQNSFIFDFISPHLYNAEKVQYRYKLEGADKDWVNVGNNSSVRFTALPPGNYAFHFAASLNGKNWLAGKAPFRFRITPPFWKRWWFLLAITCLAGASGLVLINRRIRSIKSREAEKTELQKLKAAGYQAQLETELIINHFTSSMNNFSTVEDMLWDVAKNCISKLNFEDCVIYLKDGQRDVMIQKAAWGPKNAGANNIISPIEIPVGKGIVGTVALTGKPEKIDDTSLDSRYIIDDMQRFSELAVPIFDEAKVIGVIDSECSQKAFYTDKHLQILTNIALQCGSRIATIKAEAKSRAAKIEALENRQKALEASLQSMRLQMNPHFLFNALNSIQQMILSGDETAATRFLSKFSKLLRTVLTNSDKEEITLKEELELLQLYVALESLRFKDSFTYTITCDAGIDTEEVFVPSLLFQPLVENAIWHGLMHKNGQRFLHIRFVDVAEGCLLCTIEDNGIGRQASRLVNGKDRSHTGKGVSVALERLGTLNERNGTQNSMQIIDLENDEGKATGTQINIIIYY